MSVLLPNYSVGTTTNNNLEPDNNTTSHQEEITSDGPANNGTNEGDLGESFTNTSRESQEEGSTSANSPKQPYIGLTKVREDDKESRNIKEALIKPERKEAMDAKFKALMFNQTWTLIPFKAQENIIDSKWVFKTKYKAYGSIKRRKARLVARGFQQTTDINFDEMVKSSFVRIILSIAVHFNWDIRQLDINNAFLNGNLKERVFMHQPEGYIDSTKLNHICRLSKAIYGLKHAPRASFDRLRDTLLNWGFQNTKSDSSLFILRGINHTMFLLIYVDDIIVI
ncbi:hypothetical protein V8G54_001525 [Vigna mungo]|uniref:Reverse transcriptase Ty1/copia-type domain-containing protein n=1 Tax=Vigna mungo TaxID=3915 RepID=A0AAQ3SBL2_VIGMU